MAKHCGYTGCITQRIKKFECFWQICIRELMREKTKKLLIKQWLNKLKLIISLMGTWGINSKQVFYFWSQIFFFFFFWLSFLKNKYKKNSCPIKYPNMKHALLSFLLVWSYYLMSCTRTKLVLNHNLILGGKKVQFETTLQIPKSKDFFRVFAKQKENSNLKDKKQSSYIMTCRSLGEQEYNQQIQSNSRLEPIYLTRGPQRVCRSPNMTILYIRATRVGFSILSLYVHYLTTLYLFFQTNSPAVLFIHFLFYLNILLYSFILFKYYIFYSFFIIISQQQLHKITNSHNQIFPTHCRRHHHPHHKSTQSNQNPPRPPP